MRPRWHARRDGRAGSTRSCRPASSRSPACCHARQAIAQIKHAIEKTYSKRGAEVVKRNFEAVDATLARLQEVRFQSASPRRTAVRRWCPPLAPDFVQRMTAVLLAGRETCCQ
jgi:pyruvate-ferredoxin/flavodoxin oxidoreductase